MIPKWYQNHMCVHVRLLIRVLAKVSDLIGAIDVSDRGEIGWA